MSFKVCFISHHFQSPEVLLKDIIKMTPNRSGQWKDMIAVTDPFKADVVALLDGRSNIDYPQDRAYYFGQHPYGISAFKSLEDKPKDRAFANKEHLNPGEWWVSFDYDYLTNLKTCAKIKELIAISTYYINHKITYTQRIQFLETLVKQGKTFDLYGRQSANFRSNSILNKVYRGVVGVENFNALAGEHIIGKDTLIDYKYSIEMDHGNDVDGGSLKNYFSERFYDSLLCWCMPFYFGSNNVESYLPKDAFCYIDITSESKREETAKYLQECIKSDIREQNLSAIAEARDLLLNKYQLWPFVYERVK